jgi:hypothetical protein
VSQVGTRAGRREWAGLAVIALPCLLYSMDLTVLNLAVPQLSADLQPSSAQLLRIVDIYGFLAAGSLVTMGTLGDRIGRRRLLLALGPALPEFRDPDASTGDGFQANGGESAFADDRQAPTRAGSRPSADDRQAPTGVAGRARRRRRGARRPGRAGRRSRGSGR